MDNLPKGLDCSMQAPLLTRWWSISLLALVFSTHHKVYLDICQMCINNLKSADKRVVIASNLKRIYKEPWVMADIHFLAGVSDCFFNKHMKWYQGKDSNINANGYLSMHRACRYFLQIRDLNAMENNWSQNIQFTGYREECGKLSPETTIKKEAQRRSFFKLMRNQIVKHNKRYVKGVALIRSIFAEAPLGKLVAQLLTGMVPSADDLGQHKSVVHKTTIELNNFYEFLKANVTEDEIDEI